MRTVIYVRFDGNNIPGGAHAVLGPARCEPDVATIEDVPVLGQVVVRVLLDDAGVTEFDWFPIRVDDSIG